MGLTKRLKKALETPTLPISKVGKAKLVIEELTKEKEKGTTSFDKLETFSILRQTLLMLYGTEPRKSFSDIKEDMDEIINEKQKK